MRRCSFDWFVRLWVFSYVVIISPVFAEERWVEETGGAIMGERDTTSEVEERAIKKAKALAVEGAGVQVSNTSVVYNRQIAELTKMVSNGEIKQSVVLTTLWKSDDRGRPSACEARVKCLVTLKTREDIALKLEVSKTALQEGEEAEILITANRDGYVYLFNVSPDDSVTLLLPNRLRKDHQCRAGERLTFPSGDDRRRGVRLRARLPKGEESSVEVVTAIVTEEKEPLFEMKFKESVFRVYRGEETGLIRDLMDRLARMSRWGQSLVSYSIKRNSKKEENHEK